MNGNVIKTVACLSMLLDHIGYLLFPQAEWLRWCGRLALPLFAYLVAEGCRHTRNRRRYFLRMLGLGLLCQVFGSVQGLYSGQTKLIFLNILLTLSAAQLLCFAWLDLAEATARKEGQSKALGRFSLTVAGVVAVYAFGLALKPLVGVEVQFDYGLAGMCLPLFALFGSRKPLRLLSFGVGLVCLCMSIGTAMPYAWLALLALPLLALYNGQQGDKRWQFAFYAFYPLHLSVLYGVRLLLSVI